MKVTKTTYGAHKSYYRPWVGNGAHRFGRQSQTRWRSVQRGGLLGGRERGGGGDGGIGIGQERNKERRETKTHDQHTMFTPTQEVFSWEWLGVTSVNVKSEN